MALNSIRTSKVRSVLTMLGVIIGVVSVVMVVAIGEGVKNQVVSQIDKLGNNVITIRPGASEKNTNGTLRGIRFNAPVSTSTLSEKDIAVIASVPGVIAVAPNTIITGSVSSIDNPEYANGVVYATTTDVQTVLNQTLEFGEFFGKNDVSRNVAIIGNGVAADLFGVRDPIGRVFTIKGEEFMVRGVLTVAPENPLNIGPNFNNAIYIPQDAAKSLTGGALPISEINVKLAAGQNLDEANQRIREALFKAHNGQEDFTIVSQTEYLSLANQIFTILTSFVAAVAGISLIVGGIGIMNIMLVSVSERTREIGVRKAIGATNQQILSQFLVEATVISIFGGIIGILISIFASYIIRVTTAIHPSLSLETIIIATGVATLVGITFGMAPAIQAARKDPIEALRHNH